MTRTGERQAPSVDGKTMAAALVSLGWEVQACQAELVRDSRFRPVYRYRVATGSGEGTEITERVLIGKADYRHSRASTFDFMRRLWEAGLGADGAALMPEPIAYLDDLAMLIQTEAPGRCLYEWLGSPLLDPAPAREAGSWLGRLHRLTVDGSERAVARGFEKEKLSWYCEGLAEVMPGRAGRFERATAATLAALSELDGRAVPTHGDYQPKNIYVDGSRVTVIDWDRAALGDPARDVGHFLGQCLTMSYSKTGTFENARKWNAGFLAGYDESADGVPTGVGAYVARTFLEVLYYKLVVKPVANASFAPAWLDQVDEALAA